MCPWLRRCALCLVLLSLPALASPPREDRRAARIRNPNPRPEPAEVQPSEAAPIAAAAADAGGIDLAGFLGMLTALAATFVYARGRRLSTVRSSSRMPPVVGPLDPR
jgi:hypothetical protein